MKLLIDEAKVEHALTILADKEGAGAAARASHEYERERLKVMKAKLMMKSLASSQAAKEMEAIAHPDYTAQLRHIEEIAEQDYHNRATGYFAALVSEERKLLFLMVRCLFQRYRNPWHSSHSSAVRSTLERYQNSIGAHHHPFPALPQTNRE